MCRCKCNWKPQVTSVPMSGLQMQGTHARAHTHTHTQIRCEWHRALNTLPLFAAQAHEGRVLSCAHGSAVSSTSPSGRACLLWRHGERILVVLTLALHDVLDLCQLRLQLGRLLLGGKRLCLARINSALVRRRSRCCCSCGPLPPLQLILVYNLCLKASCHGIVLPIRIVNVIHLSLLRPFCLDTPLWLRRLCCCLLLLLLLLCCALGPSMRSCSCILVLCSVLSIICTPL
mmetsp:Transcript_23806/g.65431  ORF Transcript_23806/g.65431 Transcript_23806/m.65431 type:complete len:231 (+) Transcript_23806:185-877(+)